MEQPMKMKATDFNLEKEIQFLPDQGLVVHKDTRVSKLQSMKGKMDLAVKTRVPSTKVALEDDSPELIALFEKAFHEITGMSSSEAEVKVKLMAGK